VIAVHGLVLLLGVASPVAMGGAQAGEPNPSSRAAIAEADRLFTAGEDPSQDKRALLALERALAESPNDYDLLWRAGRATAEAGDAAPPDQKPPFFERAIRYAERAVALRPGGVEGHFWLGASWGKYAEARGGLKAWRLTKKLRAEMETVLKLRPDYEDGAAYLALGELDRRLPGLFGGSKSRARAYLEQGVRVAPHNLDLKLELATLSADEGRREDARRLLEEILAAPADPVHPGADHEVRAAARRMLTQMGPR
jgi:tetratricopeptide (TPR) repeat protein